MTNYPLMGVIRVMWPFFTAWRCVSRSSTKTAKPRITRTTPTRDSSYLLLKISTKSQRIPPMGAPNIGGVG